MNNPWLNKNPFMSMWLSGAHKAAVTTRGQAAAAIKREAARASKDVTATATQQVLDFWDAVLGPSKPKAERRR